LGEAFVQKLDETLASFQQQTRPIGGYDPILCAQDVPSSISISPATMSPGGVASVVVETSFGDHSFTVELERIEEQWKIVDVFCSRERGLDAQVERLVETAKAKLADRLGISADRIHVQNVREAQFPDASLGVPEAGKTYAQVITPGYVIELAAEEKVATYHASGERIVAVPGDKDQPPGGRITVHSVEVTAAQIVIRGKSALPDGTCLNTELWADGAPLTWWPTETCAPIRQGTWELAVSLGEGQALQPGVQYMVRTYQPGGPNIVSTFPFDLDGPQKPS
jgi:hypothetical protein